MSQMEFAVGTVLRSQRTPELSGRACARARGLRIVKKPLHTVPGSARRLTFTTFPPRKRAGIDAQIPRRLLRGSQARPMSDQLFSKLTLAARCSRGTVIDPKCTRPQA